jgi:uncharacterized membrane protein
MARETPSSPRDESLEHPGQHRRALRAALTLAGLGIVVWIVGLIALVSSVRTGYIVALMVVGVTMLILAPVWYFTLMENLEPDLYRHDK